MRTALTAAPLAEERGLEPFAVDGLQEIEAGDLEMAGGHQDHQVYLGTAMGWARGDVHRALPGGPDGRAFLGRYDRAVAAVAERGAESVVLVSHGAAIRTWAAARVAGVDVDQVERTMLANTGLVEIEGDPVDGWRLVAWTAYPVGGRDLDAPAAEDPTGEPVDEPVDDQLH